MTLADCSVMVVEDHEFQRRTTLQILANLGAGALLEAADGAGALALLGSASQPDIIVCEYEIGKACVFFMSDLAAYVTGAYLPVTGGRITQMGS